MVQKNKNNLLIFDFCGTIIKGNSTLRLLAEVKSHASLSYSIKFYTFWFIAKVLKDIRIIEDNTYLNLRTKCLKNIKVETLQQAVDSLIDKSVKKQPFKMLEKQVNQRKIILSYTIDLIIEQFCRKEKIDNCTIIASVLEEKGGVLTGNYIFDLKKYGKYKRLKENIKLSSYDLSYFTDDVEADQDVVNKIPDTKVVT